MSNNKQFPNDIKDLASVEGAVSAAIVKASPKPAESFAAWRRRADKPPTAALTLPLSAVSGVQLAPELDPMRKFLALSESPRTAQTMWEALVRIGRLYGVRPEDVAWHELRRLHTQDIRIRLGGAYSPRTVNVTLAALRGVLSCAWDDELMPGDAYARAVKIKNMKVSRLPKGRWLGEDTAKVLAYCRTFGPNARNWPESAFGSFLVVSCALMLGAGLRASEVSTLTVSSFDQRARQLRLVGKGNKEAIVPLGDEVVGALEEWLAVRAELDLPDDTPLVVRVRRDGSVGPKTMLLNRRKLEHLCKQIARKALGENFSPHDLRRTFCSDLLDKGVDLSTTQRLMRHASPSTTVLYDRRPIEADAAARRKVNIFK